MSTLCATCPLSDCCDHPSSIFLQQSITEPYEHTSSTTSHPEAVQRDRSRVQCCVGHSSPRAIWNSSGFGRVTTTDERGAPDHYSSGQPTVPSGRTRLACDLVRMTGMYATGRGLRPTNVSKDVDEYGREKAELTAALVFHYPVARVNSIVV